jgi:hypothetical protein|tara:strand:- start:86 stop:925 length:840 start_codon:yes stop_codon:yes gene_type:complete
LENKKTLRNNPWVDVPMTADVWHLLKEQRVADTYYKRGNDDATQDLDWLEATHRNWVHDITDVSDFPYCYVTNGTTDAIHHWLLTEDREYQYISGDYEYPNVIKKGTEIDHAYFIDPNKVLYISNPAAHDGNFKNIEVSCPVILDCTYVSSTAIQRIDIPENTEQVFFSFSKGFGLVGQRLGLVYTKKPHKSLHTLKRFENWNYGSVKTMDLMMSNFTVDEMWNKNRETQIDICNDHGFEPSDCFFLATTKNKHYRRRRRMNNDENARICITPLFDEYK